MHCHPRERPLTKESPCCSMCSAVSIGLLSSVDRFCFTWPATQYPYRSVASNAFDAGMCSVRLTLPPPPLDSLCARFTKYENVAMGEIWTTYFLASWRIPPLVLQKGGACVCGGFCVRFVAAKGAKWLECLPLQASNNTSDWRANDTVHTHTHTGVCN